MRYSEQPAVEKTADGTVLDALAERALDRLLKESAAREPRQGSESGDSEPERAPAKNQDCG